MGTHGGSRAGSSGSGGGNKTISVDKAMENEKNAGTEALPELTGSEKQVAWANDIREKYVQEMRAFLDGDDEYFGSGPRPESAKDVLSSLERDGVSGQDPLSFQKAASGEDQPTIYWQEYYKQEREWKAQNPGRPRAEWQGSQGITPSYRSSMDDEIRAISQERKAAKASGVGMTAEEAKMAKSRVYKRYARIAFDYSLRHATSASAWIEKYKNTRFNTYYKK